MDTDLLLTATWAEALSHLAEQRREAHLQAVVERREKRRIRQKTCIVQSCPRDTSAWNLCKSHYVLMRRSYFARPAHMVNADNQLSFAKEWAAKRN